jgi:hypothetical protein
MVKTLRLTSAAAVVLAAVVFASVLGYLGPVSFLPWHAGTGSDKQTESILAGPSAVERFKTVHGKDVNTGDTTPPLIKQAETFAGVIDPPPLPGAPPTLPTNLPPKPTPGVKPLGVMSSKFELVGTCYSSNPRTSYAYIRLPDNTYQWVGVEAQIGHLAVKEIRKDSIICWDGKGNVTIAVAEVPQTASLLETGKTSEAASSAQPLNSGAAETRAETPIPAATGSAPAAFLRHSSNAARLAVSKGQPDGPSTPVPSGQISPQEQEKLDRLGERLKNDVGMDVLSRTENANRLITEFKSDRGLPPGVAKLGDTAESDPGPEPLKNTLRDEARRRYIGRLTPPRPTKD